MPKSTSSEEGHDPIRIRPRKARYVAYGLAVVIILAVIALFTFVRPNAATVLGPADYALIVVFAAVLLAVLWRQESVCATGDSTGLTVRNLFTTTRLTWTQIVSVRFSPDRPWARLDLTDGDELAVMAIQSADGEAAHREARRLAAMVDRWGSAAEPPRST